MKKIILFTIFILTCCFVSAETFEYTPNFPDLYTAREVALADSYVADYSTYFSVWSNPANAGITGDKIMLPFISLDMYSDFAKSIPFIVSSFDSTPEGIAEYITQNGTAPLNMNITGPLCIGAIKNNFFWGIFNNTYSTIDVEDATKGIVTGGEQTIFTTGYAYPIKLPFKTVISVGLSAKGFIDIQGLQEENPAQALIALKKLDFANYPLYSTFGFGFDTGITISLFDIATVSASWNNFFAGAYTKKYDNITDLKSFEKKYDTLPTMPMDDNLILGAMFKIPLDKITLGLISKFNLYTNCSNFLSMFEEQQNAESTEKPNILEHFTFGTELELLSTICLRAGLNSEHLAFGAGLKLGVIKLDVALYSKAWGIQKVDTKEMGISFSLGTYK
jgi:hypothetical protein